MKFESTEMWFNALDEWEEEVESLTQEEIEYVKMRKNLQGFVGILEN